MKSSSSCRALPRLLAVIFAIAVVGAACGSDSGSTGNGDGSTSTHSGGDPGSSTGDGNASSLGDPCALLSADDFKTATGLPFGNGTYNEKLSAPERRVCDWISNDPFATGQVLVAPGGGFTASRQGVEDAFNEKAATIDVPGADKAYATQEGSIVAMLVGDQFIQVSYIPPDPGNVTETTQSLAATAAANA